MHHFLYFTTAEIGYHSQHVPQMVFVNAVMICRE
jgi:hypothetical protein